MTDRSLILPAPMVRALLREIEAPGTGKTQHRMPAWRECDKDCKTGLYYPETILPTDGPHWHPTIWQSVKPGDRLWVQETWRTHSRYDDLAPREITARSLDYAANSHAERAGKWRPSIHMPRWASRLTLIVTETKRERVQEISDADAEAEGVEHGNRAGIDVDINSEVWPGAYREAFPALWQSLHTKPGERWEDNPEVVALTFTVHGQNIDQMERAA